MKKRATRARFLYVYNVAHYITNFPKAAKGNKTTYESRLRMDIVRFSRLGARKTSTKHGIFFFASFLLDEQKK